MRRRLLVTLASFFLIPLSGPWSAAASEVEPQLGSPQYKFSVSKHRDGPYRDDGVTANLAVGQAKNFYLKAKNKSSDSVGFTMVDDFNTTDYRSRYFRGDEKITAEVKGAGYDFEVAADGSRRLRLRVRRLQAAPPEGCIVDELEVEGLQVDNAFVQLNSNTSCD